MRQPEVFQSNQMVSVVRFLVFSVSEGWTEICR